MRETFRVTTKATILSKEGLRLIISAHPRIISGNYCRAIFTTNHRYHCTKMPVSAKALTADSPCPPQEKGKVRIYSMRFCPFAQRTRLVAAHKGLNFEEVNINLKSKPAWFLEKNPTGTVPVVEVDGQIVYESTASSDFLDDIYPNQNRLTPSDPYRRAQDRIVFESCGKYIGAGQGYVRAQGDDVSEKAEAFIKARQPFEDALKARGSLFFGGSQPAVVDFLLWPFFERIPAYAEMKKTPSVSIDSNREPKLAAWVSAMEKLPAVKQTGHDTASHVTFLTSMFSGKPEYDLGL